MTRRLRRAEQNHKAIRSVLESLEKRVLMSGSGQLAFVSGVDSHSISRIIEVERLNADGTVDGSYTGLISVNVSTVDGNGVGGATAAAQGGLAILSLPGYSNPGTSYVVAATDDLADAPVSQNVNPASAPAPTPGVRSQIVIIQQPTLDPATGTFSVIVGVEDSSGNLIPNSPANTANPSSLGIYSGPAAGMLNNANPDGVIFGRSGTILGSLNPDGTMTYSGLSVSEAGDYTFVINDATPLASVTTQSISLPATTAATTPPEYILVPHFGGLFLEWMPITKLAPSPVAVYPFTQLPAHIDNPVVKPQGVQHSASDVLASVATKPAAIEHAVEGTSLTTSSWLMQPAIAADSLEHSKRRFDASIFNYDGVIL